MSTMLGLEWGLGNWMLAEPSDLDFDMLVGILKGIDCEPVVLLLNSWVGSASKRN
jgi:hypothetical protein